MRIGEVAKRTGLKIETIRFYEAEGMITPPRRSRGNYRLYDKSQLARLSFIRRARDLGVTMAEVRELMRLADDPAASCADVDRIARRHVAAIDRRLADLKSLRAGLAERLDRCDRTTISDCGITAALTPARAIAEQARLNLPRRRS